MQRAMDQVSQSCDNYDITISTKKTEVVQQPAPGKPYNEPTSTYLESTLSRAVHSLPELQKQVWHSEDSVQMSGSEMESSLTPS